MEPQTTMDYQPTKIEAKPEDSSSTYDPVPGGAFELSSTPTTKAKAEREVLFTLDGKPHTIPKEVQTSTALAYIRSALVNGESIAVTQLLEEMLTEDGHLALLQAKNLSKDNYLDMMKVIMSKVFDALEPGKGGFSST